VRGLVAAEQLDDDVCVRIGDEMGRSVRQEFGRQASISGRVEVPDGDPDQLESPAAARREPIRPFGERPGDLAADGASSKQRSSGRDGTACPHGSGDGSRARLPAGQRRGETRGADARVTALSRSVSV
jgi:hypothetical protein